MNDPKLLKNAESKNANGGYDLENAEIGPNSYSLIPHFFCSTGLVPVLLSSINVSFRFL